MENPKLFISYCWTNSDHEDWVVDLATQLRTSGVDVILDKWRLKEGHDANVFMESMVSNPDIKRVILICNQEYAKRADNRSGGVGTETQIITPAIYGKQNQSKFVAIVRELDPDGRPYLPAYYLSRIYIDMSDLALFSEKYEQLLRWVFNKPQHIEPPLGPVPSFLLADSKAGPQIGSDAEFHRAVEAAKSGRQNSGPVIEDYLSSILRDLEKLRIAPSKMVNEIVQNVTDFIPIRNRIADLVSVIARYADNPETRKIIHRFFEQATPYFDRPVNVTSWTDSDFDNFKFIVNELYRYVIAIYLQHEKFEAAAYLIGSDYLISRKHDGGKSANRFTVFQNYLYSIDAINSASNPRKYSLHAHLLRDRCQGLGTSFVHIMQADFVLFIRSCKEAIDTDKLNTRWWPDTLIYLDFSFGAFEIFARSQSVSYLKNLLPLLGMADRKQLDQLVDLLATRQGMIPKWGFETFDPKELMAYNLLGARP